jgi:hypothetical protein
MQGSKRLNAEGFRHYKQGQLDAAKAKFEQAFRESPANLQAGFNLACTLALQGKPAEATPYLEYIVRSDRGGQFAGKMRQDPDLKVLRDQGTVEAILSRGGLSEKDHRRITKALAVAGTNTQLPPEEDVLTTDLDKDGNWEAFWWIHGLQLSVESEVVAVTKSAKGVKVAPLSLLPAYVDDGHLVASSRELGLFVSAFAASHNTTEHYLLVRVHDGEVSVVWEDSSSLEVTCLGDDCGSGADHNDQMQLTLINLDNDPLAELIVARMCDCDLGDVQVRVFDLVGDRLRPLPNAKRALAAKAAELRPLVLKGDVKAMEQLLRVLPDKLEPLVPLIKALGKAESTPPQIKVLAGLLAYYRRFASDRAWQQLLADPELKLQSRNLPPPEPPNCQAGYDGQSYVD